MTRWKRWIDKILALFSKTRLSDEELIAYGRQLEREEMQKRTYVWIDPTVRKGYPQGGAYDNLGPVTDKQRIPPALQDAKYVERIRTQHELPKVPKPPHNMSFSRLVADESWIL